MKLHRFSMYSLLLATGLLLAPSIRAQDVLIQPTAITSTTPDTFNPVNLINGSGLSGTPTLAALGTHVNTGSTTRWVTAPNGTDYFVAGAPPNLTCALPQPSLVSELVIWGYGDANEGKTFVVSFSMDGAVFGNSATVTNPTQLGSGAARLAFPGGPRNATHIRVTITDNHYTVGSTSGDRVGLGEIRFAGQPYARFDVIIQPTAITSTTPDTFNVVNLINGSGLSGTPTLGALGTHVNTGSTTRWVTAPNGTDYFVAGAPPTLTCALPQPSLVSELVIWGYGDGNEGKTFVVSFSTDGAVFGNDATVTNPTQLGSGAARLAFPGGPRNATHIRVTITDNHYTVGSIGGDRVGLGELRFAGQPYVQGIVGNLNNTPIGVDILSSISAGTPDKIAAHAFTTGPEPMELQSVTLRLRKNSAFNASARLRLWSGPGTVPATQVVDFGEVSVPNTSHENITWTALPGNLPTLAPGTRYWITVENPAFPTQLEWAVTDNTTFTGTGTLSTSRAVSTDGGTTWTDATNGRNHLLQVVGRMRIQVTNTSDSETGSLRWAIAAATANPGADTITFAPGLSGQSIQLTTVGHSGTHVNDKSALHINGDIDGVIIDATALPGGITLSDNGGTTHRLLRISNSIVTLSGLTFKDGGIATFGASSGGAIASGQSSVQIERCSFSGNIGDGGGAIFADHSTGGSMNLRHSTFAGNTTTSAGANTGDGGAIFNLGGEMSLSHCTVVGNTAPTGAPGTGGIMGYLGSVTLTNCIVADNTCSGVPGDVRYHSSTLYIQGTNIIPTSINAGGTLQNNGILLTSAPNLAPLDEYGGPTPTMPPMAGSPAIDATSATTITDQRGFPAQDGDGNGSVLADIGAAEAQVRLVTTPIDEDNGIGTGAGTSLREAIAGISGLAEIILFDPAVFASQPGQIIRLTVPNAPAGNQQITIARALSVDARNLPSGVTISGDSNNNGPDASDTRIFEVNPGQTVALLGLTLQGGRDSGNGGGGIYNRGTLAVDQCTLSGNWALNPGGAIHNLGTLTVNTSTFSGNTATTGGAIYSQTSSVTGPITSSTRLSHCTLSGNTGATHGGAIHNQNGRTTILHCTVSGNTAPTGMGGGVASFGDFFTETVVQNSIVAGNTSGDVAFVVRSNNSFTSLGNNRIGDGIGTGDFNQSGDTVNHTAASIALAPLGDYGGPTLTMTPLPGSPALNAATGSAITADQRGFPIVGTPDIGAVEYQGRADLARFWPTDWDGDGEAFGVEQALGRDPLQADETSSDRLQLGMVGGLPRILFGMNFDLAGNTDWILERATTLSPPDFVEVFRYTGRTGHQSIAPGITTSLAPSAPGWLMTVTDATPNAKQGYYRLSAVLAP